MPEWEWLWLFIFPSNMFSNLTYSIQYLIHNHFLISCCLLFIYLLTRFIPQNVYNQMAEWLKDDDLEFVVAQFKFPSRGSFEEVNSKATYDMAYLGAEIWFSNLQHEKQVYWFQFDHHVCFLNPEICRLWHLLISWNKLWN